MSNLLLDPGEIAYNAYCQTRNWKSVKGEPLPQFSEQSPELQQSWRAVFKAVKEAVEDGADKK